MNWRTKLGSTLVAPMLYYGLSVLNPSTTDAALPSEPQEPAVPKSKLRKVSKNREESYFTMPVPERYESFKKKGLDCKVDGDSGNLVLTCKTKPQRRASFFFEDSKFGLGALRNGDSAAMDELIGGDGRLGFKALLGYEDFVLGVGAEQQTIFQKIKVGVSDEWDASILGVSYHINLDFRWYFGENKNIFVGVGNDHISDRLIEGDVEYERFFSVHPEVTIDSPVIDVVSYQLGGKFKFGEG